MSVTKETHNFIGVRYINKDSLSASEFSYAIKKCFDVGLRDIVVAPTINGDQVAIVTSINKELPPYFYTSNGIKVIDKRTNKFNQKYINQSIGEYSTKNFVKKKEENVFIICFIS